jgi:WD40 repeat protein
MFVSHRYRAGNRNRFSADTIWQDPFQIRFRHRGSRALTGHSQDVIWVAFSPDGRMLASGSYDNTLKIWEPNSGRLLATLMILPPGKKGEANEWIASTPEGYYTASVGASRFIRWRVGDQLAPAATYETTFHRPDLVEKSLKGEQ